MGRRWEACRAAACWLWRRLCVRRRANVLIVLVDNFVVVVVAREEVGYGWCSEYFNFLKSASWALKLITSCFSTYFPQISEIYGPAQSVFFGYFLSKQNYKSHPR